MDIGDIIFFLIIIGLPLIQWLTRKKEEEIGFPEEDIREFDTGESPDTTYRTKRDLSDPNREWEDLMEALGRPTVVTEPAPPPLQPEPKPIASTPAPPPVPEPALLPRLDPRVERLNQALRESRPDRQPDAPVLNNLAPGHVHQFVSSRSPASGRIRTILRNPQSIRDAILINEILGQPASMRRISP